MFFYKIASSLGEERSRLSAWKRCLDISCTSRGSSCHERLDISKPKRELQSHHGAPTVRYGLRCIGDPSFVPLKPNEVNKLIERCILFGVDAFFIL